MIALSIWHWFALAAILGILEVTLGANFIFLACGIVAVFTGILLWLIPMMSVEWQGLFFGIGMIVSLFFWHKYLKKRKPTGEVSYLNQRARQYINRYFTLEEPIVNGRGRVKVDDTIWRVEGEDLAAGTRIQVIDVDGNILRIKKAES